MSIAGRFMDGLTMHYYTVPGGWDHKLPATGFDKAQYFETLDRARKMDGLIEGHLAVMDRYDPEHRVGLIVDEWGTWFEVEPRHRPRLPIPAEHSAGRAGRRPDAGYFHPPL